MGGDQDLRLAEIRERLKAVPDPVALLEGIFANAPVGFQVYARDGHSLLTNRAFRDMFGSEPPPGYNVLEDELARAGGVLDHIHRAFAGETVHLPPFWYDPRELTQVKVTEGRRVAIESTFFPLLDAQGAVSQVAVVFEDVTAAVVERERAERQERRYRTLVQASTQIVWSADATGTIVEDSPSWEAFTGQPPGAILRGSWLEAVHPDDRERVAAAWAGGLARGAPFEVEHRLRRADGSYAPMRGRAVPVRGPGGEVLEWVGTNQDVSAERTLGAQLEALLAREREARAQAEAASRAKDEFLAMLGHELRNPLAPITTALELMRLRGAPSREAELIGRQVQQLVRLVDDLLDVSRIARGKVALERNAVALDALLAEALETAAPLLEERRHQVTVAAEPGLWLLGDALRLAQVVANLLTNAAKYTPPGGRVEVRARRAGAEVEVSVRDNGVGLSPELLPRVFDLFVQGERGPDRGGGGLGLGLALVKNLVALHGGRVEARSEGPGRGSEFVLWLPAAPAPAQAAPAPARTLPASARPRAVLVVDDNRDAAELLAELLRDAGHAVEVAHDGPAALARLARFRPEVAILDLGLPVMDGFELAARVRELVPEARLFALTGYGLEGDRQRTRAAGFERHYVKPIDVAELLASLDALG